MTIKLVDARNFNPLVGPTALFLAPSGRPVFSHRGADGDGGESEDDEGDDDSEDDDSDNDSDDDSDDDAKGKDDKGKKKSKPRTIDPDDYDEQVSHKERLRRQLSESDKKKAAAEKRVAELEKSALPDKEKAAAELKEITEERDSFKARFTNLARTNAFLTASARAGINWHDPEDAQSVAHRQLKELDIDDDGAVDGIEELVKGLAKRKPHLVKVEKSDDDDDEKKKRKGASGSGVGSGKKTGTGGKSKNGELSEEELYRRFPALKR